MAVLYVSEFVTLPFLDAHSVSIAEMPPKVEQTVAIGGSTTQSSAFGNSTKVVRLHTDAICSIAFGSNPTATATTARMAANQTEYFKVTPGHKVAVITNT